MKYGSKKMKKMQPGGVTNRPSSASSSIKATDMYTEKMLRNQLPKASRGTIVGLNGNVSAQMVPGSKGVMTNLNPSVSAQTAASGYRGGISSAPATALPKAMYGAMLRKKK